MSLTSGSYLSEIPEKIPIQEYIRLYILEATLRWLIKIYLKQQKLNVGKISNIIHNAKNKLKRQKEMEKQINIPETLYEDWIGYLDFPDDYIKIIEDFLEVPVKLISVGSKRNAVIKK